MSYHSWRVTCPPGLAPPSPRCTSMHASAPHLRLRPAPSPGAATPLSAPLERLWHAGRPTDAHQRFSRCFSVGATNPLRRSAVCVCKRPPTTCCAIEIKSESNSHESIYFSGAHQHRASVSDPNELSSLSLFLSEGLDCPSYPQTLTDTRPHPPTGRQQQQQQPIRWQHSRFRKPNDWTTQSGKRRGAKTC